ncbi:hypothetical protein ABW20_dc0100889 [Dactylellina cionopaga]|nr:hypothetical protein ABW20_dc0100889 [Dactylellina cionopaga]
MASRQIMQYVRRGGKYLGFGAGASFASARVEFEKGNKALEVTGSRELGLFPGTSQGTAGTEVRALGVIGKLLEFNAPTGFSSYWRGGGAFLDAELFAERGVEILARYSDKVVRGPVEGDVATVGCTVGAGYALLIGAHPE